MSTVGGRTTKCGCGSRATDSVESSCPRSSAATEYTAPRWSPPSISMRSSPASTCAPSTPASRGRSWSWFRMTPDTASPMTSADNPGGDERTSMEHVRRLEADIAALRTELQRKDEALARLSARLVDVEAAREAGAKRERDDRIEAELELARLEATKLYRYALRPRDALYRRRQRLS